MGRRREHPLPDLPISVETLPPPEPKRSERMMVSFSPTEMAMIEKAAELRGEQPAVLCRTIILTAFQISAAQALAKKPDLLDLSPAEQQRILLDAFSIKPAKRPARAS